MHSVSLNDSYFQYFHCFCYIAIFLENDTNNNVSNKHVIHLGRLEENYMNFFSGVIYMMASTHTTNTELF